MDNRKSSELDLIYRKSIFNLKPGTQIPGYTGHRPGVRFAFGNTYGDLTRQLNALTSPADDTSLDVWSSELDSEKMHRSEKSGGWKNPKNDSSAMNKLLQGLDLDAEDLNRSRPFLCTEKPSPPPSGLKSGYTGYVPRLRYRYGSSFNPSATEAKQEFEQQQQLDKYQRLQLDPAAAGFNSPLHPVNDDRKVLEELLRLQQQRQLLQMASARNNRHIL